MTTSSNLLRDCEKLWWHRLLAVESMRGFAWQSKRHRDRIGSCLGVSEGNDPRAAQLVFQAMLSELALEPADYNLQALAWASRAYWEVYVCLLYAGVENHRAIGAKHPSVAHQPLVDFLDSCPGLEDKLCSVRDKLLHPENEANYDDELRELVAAARRTAPDLYQALERLQGHLDDFLDRLRGFLQQSIRSDVDRLPIAERLAYLQRFEMELRNQAEKAGAVEVVAGLDRLAADRDGQRSPTRPSDDKPPMPKHTERVNQLETVRQSLGSPRPRDVRRVDIGAASSASSSGGCSLVDCRGRGGCASCVVVVA